jgi:hypothetical protein
MKTKLIITEGQFEKLKTYITESEVYTSVVKQIKDELDGNYTPTQSYVRSGGEYMSKPMITVKVDDEVITPKALFDYLKFKYKVNDEFIKQVIKDWMFGRISDTYQLSKNVPIN